MPLSAARRSALALAVAALSAAPASADVPLDACLRAYDEAQPLQRDGKLTAARARLLVCARDACPTAVRAECGQWLERLELDQPSVVFAARDRQGDVPGATVSVDGATFTRQLDGKAVALDPGPHVARFERPGSPPLDVALAIRQGEKNRLVTARFDDVRPPTAAPPREATIHRAPAALPAVGFGAAGVAVAGVAAFAVLGLEAKHTLDQKIDQCQGHCDPSTSDPARRLALAADLSLGVGLASAAVATYLLWPRPAAPRAAALSFSSRPGGGVAALGMRF